MLKSIIFEEKKNDVLLFLKDKMIEKKMVLLLGDQIYLFGSSKQVD